MSGHSKWSNIKHKKGAEDAKRGKIFQKITKEMLIAVKEGGPDPEINSKLRLIIEKAKAANMPNDNINRNLTKNEKDTTLWNEVIYEGYGPGGIAVLVNCLTDNINRTAASIKSNFTKGNGNLGINGSVSYLFETKGIIVLDLKIYSIDEILSIVLEAPILNISEEKEVIIIETKPNKFIEIKELLENNNVNFFLTSKVTKIATQQIELNKNETERLNKLIEILEDNDDVNEVYTNAK